MIDKRNGILIGLAAVLILAAGLFITVRSANGVALTDATASYAGDT